MDTLRDLLIYLYEIFEGDNDKIIMELIKKEYCGIITDDKIKKFFKKHHINTQNYITYLDEEKRYLKRINKDLTHPIIVYKLKKKR